MRSLVSLSFSLSPCPFLCRCVCVCVLCVSSLFSLHKLTAACPAAAAASCGCPSAASILAQHERKIVVGNCNYCLSIEALLLLLLLILLLLLLLPQHASVKLRQQLSGCRLFYCCCVRLSRFLCVGHPHTHAHTYVCVRIRTHVCVYLIGESNLGSTTL